MMDNKNVYNNFVLKKINLRKIFFGKNDDKKII